MPIIGQPAHTHFTPIVTPVALDRISLSVTYLYDVSAAAFRVSLARTYQYDLKVIVSRSQAYLYNLNPVTPVGPTRLYFHAVLNPLPNLPTTERSTLTPIKTADAETVNRTMSTVIGVAQTSINLTSNATTTLQRYYFSKFVTDTLTNVTSITAQTWTYNFAATGSPTFGANFPVSTTNLPVRVVAYVWRPSTQSKVGDIVDGNSASTVDKATSEKVHHTTFLGNQVLNVLAGDVLVFEVWFEITQQTASAFPETFYYDGTTVNTTKNASVTNHASFIQTPQGLSFGIALTRVSKPRIYKYDIIKRLSLSQTYKYHTTALASRSRAYNYDIASLVSLPNSYLYDLTGRLSVPSINKYDILKIITAPKIFRYALQSTLQFSRDYKYNIANAVDTLSQVYKYNIANAAQLVQTYKYQIYKAVQFSRLYKYSLISRLSLSPIYKYNIANRIASSTIYKYALALRLSLSRAYKYNLLNRLTSASHYKYAINTRLSLSRIYKFNIAKLVTFAQVYKYNLTSLAHVVLSSIYKYNLVNRLTLTRTYAYSLLNKITLSRIYRYVLTVRITTSTIYRYAVLNSVTLTKTYRYNLLVRLTSLRNYLYNLLKLIQKPEVHKYHLLKLISSARIYKYRLGSGVSFTQTYLYNTKARVSLSTKYIYGILVLPSGVLWQLTGKNTDFPDSLENLVRDYIKENWSITEPVLGQTPIITTVLSRQHQSQIDNFAYDSYRTYYIRVKEVASEVKNRQVRLNTYEFSTPIELELFSRRLKKGEAFAELNNMMNELLRIFGTYQVDGIFGVQGITLDRISNMEKERPPAQTTWARKLRIILHYYKVSVIG